MNPQWIQVTTAGGVLSEASEAALEKLLCAPFASRLHAREPALFGTAPERQAVVKNRLGWLDGPSWLAGRVTELRALAARVEAERFRHVVLLGMGGSSLCPEVLSQVFGLPPGLRSFAICDATDPRAIARIEAEINPAETLFIVASKSGGTTETRAQAAYFHDLVQTATGRAGRQFVAITDAGSTLEQWAEESGFAHLFLNPPDIGGRFSALSYFGMLPGALLGVPLQPFLERTQRIAARLRADDAVNPGLRLGALVAQAALSGRDKLTFVTSAKAAPLVPWIEQLVAESTGKEGTGVVPVEAEPTGTPDRYGDDRLFCFLRFAGDGADGALRGEVCRLARPYTDIVIPETADLGAFFLLWEFAVSAAGWLLDINPFDEPNVQESKDNTRQLLEVFAREGRLPAEPPQVRTEHFLLSAANCEDRGEGLPQALLSGVAPGDYVALLYFGDRRPRIESLLNELRGSIRDRLRVATLRGYGPRYLHSIGQLHKGGRPNGHFLLFTEEAPEDRAIPGRKHTFGTLLAAQALGDFQALAGRGLPVLRVHLKGDPELSLRAFASELNARVTARA